MCQHQPLCPWRAHQIARQPTSWASHPEQRWSPLCNGAVAFDDTGVLLPDGRSISRTSRPNSKVTALLPRRLRPVTA